MHSLTLDSVDKKVNFAPCMQRFSYSRKALILRPQPAHWTWPENTALGWDWMLPICFQRGLTHGFQLGPPTIPAVSPSIKPTLALSFYEFFFFFHRTETIPCLTFSHSLHISLSFVVTLIQYPPITVSLPPLPVVEVVSVMAVGRLPAAGEILINSLFICVERRAPAFWALVLWWR